MEQLQVKPLQLKIGIYGLLLIAVFYLSVIEPFRFTGSYESDYIDREIVYFESRGTPLQPNSREMNIVLEGARQASSVQLSGHISLIWLFISGIFFVVPIFFTPAKLHEIFYFYWPALLGISGIGYVGISVPIFIWCITVGIKYLVLKKRQNNA